MNKAFYYLRDRKNRPIVTVCLYSTSCDYARGIAICSERDEPNKKIGRAISQGRAFKALELNETSDPIVRDRAIGQLFSATAFPVYPPFKSEVNPVLSNFEKKILDKHREIK